MPIDVLICASVTRGRTPDRFGAILGCQRIDRLAVHPTDPGKRHPECLGSRSRSSLGWILVTGVPDSVAWYSGGGLNQVESPLALRNDDGTFRWFVHEGRARAATARAPTLVDRALDREQDTDVDDLPTLPWAAFLSILYDGNVGPDSRPTQEDVETHTVWDGTGYPPGWQE